MPLGNTWNKQGEQRQDSQYDNAELAACVRTQNDTQQTGCTYGEPLPDEIRPPIPESIELTCQGIEQTKESGGDLRSCDADIATRERNDADDMLLLRRSASPTSGAPHRTKDEGGTVTGQHGGHERPNTPDINHRPSTPPSPPHFPFPARWTSSIARDDQGRIGMGGHPRAQQ